MHSMILSVFVVVAVVSSQCAARLQEPSCGSYDIFEKLLTKMLNLEHKMDTFESFMTKWETRDEARAVQMTAASAALTSWESRLESAETRLQDQTAVITTTLEAALQNHEQELQAFQQAYKTPTVFFTATHVDNKDVTEGVVIKFETLVNNEGDGYDKNTGKFTAPHDGLYLFQVTVCSRYENNVYVHLLAANTVIGATRKYSKYASGSCTSMSGMATLSAGDEAWVQGSHTQSGALYDHSTYTWPSFSGMLVHK